jgi:DNA-binding winged helix-turn-helix (wHTH) protein/tetratricopeptide (TPR) repeat protein
MSLSPKGLYRFEEFELDTARRALTRSGTVIPLSSKAFQVLCYLVANPGRVVTKDELLKAVWPESFVEESNLPGYISGLRKALTDCAGYIATVPGQGYQFTAHVQMEEPAGLISHSRAGELEAPPVEHTQVLRETTHVLIRETSSPVLALEAPQSRFRSWLVWAALALVAAVAGGFAWARFHRPAPADYHQVVLADFDNRSGEEVFDFVLKNALEIDLEQSPLFTALSVGQTRRTLQQMAKSPDERLTPAIAREVCERSGSQAVLGGSIVKLGSGFVVTLDATDCVSGKQIAKYADEAQTQEETLRVVGDMTAQMRHRLGESLRSVQGFDVPIEQSTTASFDALVAYSRGVQHLLRMDGEGIPFFQRAIQLDPNFAMAYEQLGATYGNMVDLPRAKQAFAKAYELRQHAGPSEQFVITSRYDEIVQGDLDLAASNYELWARSYPLNRFVWSTLANTYTQMGRYPEAIAAAERARSVDPNYAFAYVVLARAYKRASQFEQAKRVCHEAIAHKVDVWGVHSILYQMAVYERDQAAMAREAAWDKGQSTENQTLNNVAAAAAVMGQLQKANQIFQQAKDSPAGRSTADYVFDVDADTAEVDRLLGDYAHAREFATRVPVDSDDISFEAAINAALAGDTTYAKRVIEDEKKAAATNTVVQKVWVPLLNAAIMLAEHKPERVAPLLQPARAYELRDYYVPSLLGQAFLDLHRPAEAEAAYKQIIANPGIDPTTPMLPLAHLGLARAYAQEGRKEESQKEYETLFTLWKDADADLPILRLAHKEYDASKSARMG